MEERIKNSCKTLRGLRPQREKYEKVGERGRGRDERAGVCRQLSRSMARMQTQESSQMQTQAEWAEERGATTSVHPALVMLASHNCHTQTFWLSLYWDFSVYYVCVSRQRHCCQMGIRCQVRLLSVQCEETRMLLEGATSLERMCACITGN